MKLKAFVVMGLLAASSVSFAMSSAKPTWWVGGGGNVSLADNLDSLTRIQVSLMPYSDKKGVWLKNCSEGTMKLTPEHEPVVCTVPAHQAFGAQITNVDPNSMEQSWGSHKILK